VIWTVSLSHSLLVHGIDLCALSLHLVSHDSSVREWMYLTVCPLHARVMIAQWENECISLSVLSVARVMIAQWESECISLSVLSMARVQFPAVAKSFKGFFPGWSHRLGEEMGTAKSLQAHWKDMRNMKQYTFFCPQVPPTIIFFKSLSHYQSQS